jgi:Tol biopolymer transport system component
MNPSYINNPKNQKAMKHLLTLRPLAALLLLLSALATQAHEGIFFVKTVANNADIYYMPDDENPSNVVRLTTHAGIDNHPDVYIMTTPPYDTVVVWSTDRDGNFELYMGTLPDLEATATRLTNNTYPDRHPHFSANGTRIIYTAKYNFEPSTVCPKDECSIPVSAPCGWYEGMRILVLNSLTIYDLDFRNMPITGGGTWPNLFSTWVGHPCFSQDESKLLFSAALDEAGSDWEVYSVDFTSPNILSNLTQITKGSLYPANPNPIPMSAGATFIDNDTKILYSSTRTPLGNSQLFIIPATSVAAPVSPMNQLTWHYGNDYVPEQLEDGTILYTSDLGPNNICPPPDSGATDDLDLWLINPNGTGWQNLTDNDLNNEQQLIGDEVSWFCGVKPNLSECTVFPKAWNVCWFREVKMMAESPTYMPDFPHRNLYPIFYNTVCNYIYQHDPLYYQQLQQALLTYDIPCTHSWLTVPSWWIIPSMFEKWDHNLPASPALVLPPNKSTINNAPILHTWTLLEEAQTYGIEIDDDPSFQTPIVQLSGLLTPQYTGSLPNGLYYWRASATNTYGTTWSTVWYFTVDITIGIETLNTQAAKELKLNLQPNPFSNETTIQIALPQSGEVKLLVFDAQGKSVQTILQQNMPAGIQQIRWNAQHLPAGKYFCKLETAGNSVTKKIVITR